MRTAAQIKNANQDLHHIFHTTVKYGKLNTTMTTYNCSTMSSMQHYEHMSQVKPKQTLMAMVTCDYRSKFTQTHSGLARLGHFQSSIRKQPNLVRLDQVSSMAQNFSVFIEITQMTRTNKM